ncbi:uncharacterized protein LOC125677910 isoform X1 [Ostrea edulis]|uniref:uncharacterized protein LOC125677910 isoform X1 n=1 Tax=Ostrea edulis TaxID=37623 RepID=UPI0024AF7121|nr:uncharacterized protein LOC125677910 isoform X1 [Ostrea edulis]
MKLAKYYTTDPVNPSIKEGYKQLAPGTPVVVDALWLHGALSSVRGKDRAGSKKKPQKPEAIIKHLMDGFFTIKDLVGKGEPAGFWTAQYTPPLNVSILPLVYQLGSWSI